MYTSHLRSKGTASAWITYCNGFGYVIHTNAKIENNYNMLFYSAITSLIIPQQNSLDKFDRLLFMSNGAVWLKLKLQL